ncbi:MAG: ABC transporter permease [Bacteroidales bacterium]|nr:ABC transporter permease [Bacteroidales bacterium]
MKRGIKGIVIWVRIIRESTAFAVHSLISNKLRTILSLLGITIGIFAIVSVFTVVDSLGRTIKKNISELGDNVVYIEKWPMAFGPGFQWWKYIQRPEPELREMDEIMERARTVESSAFSLQYQRTLSFENSSIPETWILAVSDDYDKIRSFDVEEGRFFSLSEFRSGKDVAVIGRKIADDLFPGISPIGKTFEVSGAKVTVVGVFKKEGEGINAGSHDEITMIPLNFARTQVNMRSSNINPTLMVKSKPGISIDELSDELTGIMRSIRKLKPMEEDNFALNTMSMLSKAFDGLLATLNIAGLIIGGFAILVGGFGIANIMFVSVKERTRIIGIQKAIGARNIFILFEFLFEAVSLSLMGGVVGLLLIFIGSLVANTMMEFQIVLGLNNIMIGLTISAIIGIIAGFAPAWRASRLSPVVAMGTV